MTLFEMSSQSGGVGRMLLEHVSTYWAVFFVPHKLSIGLDVLKVITGAFLHETSAPQRAMMIF